MTVRLRVSGDPAEIEIMLKVLAVVFDFTGSHRLYSNHACPGCPRLPHGADPVGR